MDNCQRSDYVVSLAPGGMVKVGMERREWYRVL